MEPLNLMVSLSHFANAGRENQRGLSKPAGCRRRLRDLLAARKARRIAATHVKVLT